LEYDKGMDYKHSIVRLQSVVLHNIKNVVGGTIVFPSKAKPESLDERADVVGVYGQNGSGKTALVEALRMLKSMLSGLPLSGNLANDIRQGQADPSMAFDFEFLIYDGTQRFSVFYSFLLKEGGKNPLNGQRTIKVINELFKVKKLHLAKDNLTTIFDTNLSLDEAKKIAFKPIVSLEAIAKGKGQTLEQDLLFARHDAGEIGQSFIFSPKTIGLLKNSAIDVDYLAVVLSLRRYGSTDLLIINTEECNQFFMVVNLRVKNEETTDAGLIPVGFQSTTLPSSLFHDLQKWVPSVNVILSHLVPGLQIGLDNVFPLTTLGNDGAPIQSNRFQMVSIRNGIRIPLEYESGGIRKIIACLGALISSFSNESVLAVIDEFDSGVFEYLLGEIVSVFSDSAKGQLLFTSHNLRPLEVLGNHGIYLTTTDPNDRYAEYPYTKDTINFRSRYLRDIKLDSQTTSDGNKREYYSATSEDDIRHAFNMAGGDR
jgi:energy-coupling factor transporter ATP-binding protein EcfA2